MAQTIEGSEVMITVVFWGGAIVSLKVTFQHNTTASMLEEKSCNIVRLRFDFGIFADPSYTVYLNHLQVKRVRLNQSVAFEGSGAELQQG